MKNTELCVFWLNGLFQLKTHPNPDVSKYVDQLLNEAGMPGISISEVLYPLMNLPDSELTNMERFVKKFVLNRNK